MKDENFVMIIACICVILITWIFLSFGSSPILDNKEDPFIVRKISTCWWTPGHARYYGKKQKAPLTSPKSIILEIGKYNVGDTILLKK